jgi:two-component system, sensor histidine kinase and response regulator
MTDLTLETELTEEQREFLSIVKLSAANLLQALTDILDFSNIETKALELEAIEFDFRRLLADTLEPFRSQATQKSLDLTWEIAEELPLVLIGDPARVRQMIAILVGNALRFTEKGFIKVVAAVEPVTEGIAGVHVSVTDTGIGVPEDKRRLIFEAFQQADGSSTRKYGGTGLGLAICAQLVEMMGGRIWVESEFGKGSTFHFTARFPQSQIDGLPVCSQEGVVPADLQLN